MGNIHLTLKNRESRLAADFRDDLLAQVTAIQQTLAELSHTHHPGSIELVVALYPDHASYLEYARAVTGHDMPNSGGFYSRKRNEAVTYIRQDNAKTLEFARHESTHVITTQMYGLLPKWLNEGLADYFSTLQTGSAAPEMEAKRGWRALASTSVSQGHPADLQQLLSLDSKGWNNGHKNANYAVSFALVHFLMSSDAGKASIGALLERSAKRRGITVDSISVMDKHYPGGWAQLQQDFVQWIAAEEMNPPARHRRS